MSIVIAVDIDGVLADFQHKLLDSIEKLYGISVNNNAIRAWDLKHALGISDDEERALMQAIFADNDNFPLVPAARAGCTTLKEQGFEVIAVTARRDVDITYEWLQMNELGFIGPYFMTLTGDIPSFDYLLDDSPKKIARLVHKTKKQAFLFSTPWNEHCYDLFGRWSRIDNWSHFLHEMSVRHPLVK